MKTIKSVSMKNLELVLCLDENWYFIELNGKRIHTSIHLDRSLYRFDMEYNDYCLRNN